MRQEFCSAEAIHEILIDVELHVSNALADPIGLIVIFVGLKRQGCTAQRTVSQRFVRVRRQVRQHADGYGRFRVD